MRKLQLTNNKETIVDKVVYDKYKEHKWYYVGGYAATKIGGKTEYLHRLIMQTPKGLATDHINGDRLDNRIKNLRICSRQQNNCNSKVQVNNKLGFKGVCQVSKNSYRAQIWCNGKIYQKGGFSTPKEAAVAYNEMAQKLHKGFARLNAMSSDKD